MPRPFHFSLEKVLQYRQQLEDQAQLALAQAQKRYQEQTRRLESLKEQLQTQEEYFQAQTNITANDIWLWRNYKERLLQEIQQAEEKLRQLASEVNKRRTEAVNKAKDRKLLEKLKTNQLNKHLEQEQHKEQQEFDEMATLRHQDRHT